MNFVASAFGLTFVCAEPIPGLVPGGPAAPDPVTVHLRAMPAWVNLAEAEARPAAFPPPSEGFRASPLRIWTLEGGALLFAYDDGTRFVLDRAATRVWATWPAAATLEDTATYLLGPIAGYLLRLRGRVPLHASGVVVEGELVALVGASGAGKSTTAAAFAARGHAVFADDTVALSAGAEGIRADSAYAFLRLWPESVEMLYGHAEALPLLTPNWEKRYLDLAGSGGFQARALPLGAVYFLGRRSAGAAVPEVRPLPPHEALLLLVANTSSNHLLDENMRRTEFELLSRMVSEVPTRFVTPPADARTLPELCAAILRDHAALRAGGR
jgi:hypothetical protein